MEKSISKSKIRKHLPGLLILALGALLFSGCSKNDNNLSPQEPAKSVNDIPTVLENISSQDSLKEDVSVSKHYSSRHHRKSFRTLLTALVKTNLLGTVANNKLTLFAPTDEAFAEIGLNPRNIGSVPNLKEILLYHVISGQVYSSSLSSKFFPTLNGAALDVKVDGDDIMINDANVIRADIWAFNGVIHVIDKVLLPPTKNLVELALSFDPEFSILVKAVEKAGLVETLSTGGPFTIFAPTNAAFVSLLAELGKNSLDDIDAATLKNVLLYHAVNGRVYSSDLVSGTVTTLNGSFLVNVPLLTITDSKSRVANLVPSLLDIQATNGVIHVIDKVLLP